ncbi:MAG: calcium-binding protein, partial [Rhodocyclaceae bacterium]|nr:calcium-binding protein [Rhodocyclaceae bacterium]
MATFTNLASNVGGSPFSATLTNSIISAVQSGEAGNIGNNLSRLTDLLGSFDSANLDEAGFESNTATKAKYFLSGNLLDPGAGFLQILGSNMPIYDPVSGSYPDPAANFRITSIEYRNSFLNNLRFVVAGTFSTTTTTITSIETGDDFFSVKVSGSISVDNTAGTLSSAALSSIAVSFVDDDGAVVTATLGVSLSLTNQSLSVNSLAISKGSQSLFSAQNLGLRYSFGDAAANNPFTIGSLSAGRLSTEFLFSANDVITGTSGTDSLGGYGGNDSINAGSGRDVVGGGVGNDTLLGVAGADTLSGDDGNDSLLGGTEGDCLYGGNGNDVLSGDAGNDFLAGGAGRDMLLGGVGSDTLAGGEAFADRFGLYIVTPSDSIDTLNGGAGDDTYVIDNAGLVVVDSGGYDTGVVSINGFVATGGGFAQIEKFLLYDDGRGRRFTANALNNVVIGGSAAETIDGGAGKDLLRGGAGADVLTGGADRDTFVFAAGDSGQATGFDTITDLAKGAAGTGDLIDYSAALTCGGNTTSATDSQASINQTTGVATFASGSGTTMA